MKYDINRPWLTLDPWQKDYINSDPDENCFLLCGRQVGKTTAMSIKAVELCINHFKKGEYILICSITEKQGYHLLAKCLAYAESKYKPQIRKGKNKPTMHKVHFKNGTGILSFAAGETGVGLRGYTIKKLMIDEGSRMSEEFYIAVSPMLSVIRGSMDIGSTPCGKVGFFYQCSKDKKFRKFYVSAEDCPRHTKEFLNNEKERLPRLAYAQEYLAIFTDELRRLISNETIKRACVLERVDINYKGEFYLGLDIAGLGKDETTYEILERSNEKIYHRANLIEKRNRTSETSQKILYLNKAHNFRRIGIDDAGVGFGVWSELMDNDATKRKTIALNNASRPTDREGTKSKKLLKEEMYFNFISMLESGRLLLLDDDEVKQSLASLQFEIVIRANEKTKERIFGSYTHIAEGLIRAAWLAKDKPLNIFARSF